MTPSRIPALVSIVGKSGSGKTTLIEKLIPLLSDRGLRVGTIKHHAHDAEVDHPGKDTYRHREAGARVVALTSSELVFTIRTVTEPPSLEELVVDVFAGHVELVLAEGFKRSDAPKIEVHRAERSPELICEALGDNLIAIASDTTWKLGVPCFDLNDAGAIADFIYKTFIVDAPPGLGHPGGFPEGHPHGHPEGHPHGHPGGHPGGHPYGHPGGHPGGHPR